MRVAVITPAFNAEAHIAATAQSIATQHALQSDSGVSVTYILQDGNSRDNTVQVAARIAEEHGSDRLTFRAYSEPDTGMYSALQRGFERAEELGGADWYCYLNAGDLWDPRCLDVLSLLHHQTTESWVMGLHTYYAQDGSLVHTRLPFRYSQHLLRAGAYGRGLPTVQQESTFWRAELNNSIDWKRLTDFRVAGDSFLWWSMASVTEPAIVQAVLGGFRYHGGHLGVDKNEYREEISSFAGELSLATRAQIAAQVPLWEQPARLKARMNPHLYAYNITTGGWDSRRTRVLPLPSSPAADE